jgi:hypothetical protein
MLDGFRLGPASPTGPVTPLAPFERVRVPLLPVEEQPIVLRAGMTLHLVREYRVPGPHTVTMWVQEYATPGQAMAAEQAVAAAVCGYAVDVFAEPTAPALGALGMELHTVDNRLRIVQLSLTAGPRRVVIQGWTSPPERPDRATLAAVVRCSLLLAAGRVRPSPSANVDPCAP